MGEGPTEHLRHSEEWSACKDTRGMNYTMNNDILEGQAGVDDKETLCAPEAVVSETKVLLFPPSLKCSVSVQVYIIPGVTGKLINTTSLSIITTSINTSEHITQLLISTLIKKPKNT